MDLNFRYFLLNEGTVYLGQMLGDILNAMQELAEEAPQMGSRQLTKHCERIVALIRRILHSSWQQQDKKHLEGLQKIGVAIMKAIEEKGDLVETLQSASSELEEILAKMKVPVHQIGGGEKKEPEEATGVDKPEKGPPKQPPPPQPQQSQEPAPPPPQGPQPQ
jgi:outer membrane biosynthesis protein TonB